MKVVVIYIPLIILTALLRYNFRKKKQRWTPSNLLIATYLLMAMCVIIYDINSKYFFYNNIEYNLEAIVYFTVAISLFIIPFIHYDETKTKIIYIRNQHLLNLLIGAIIVFSFISILFFIPNTIEALSGNIKQNRIDNMMAQKYAQGNLLNTFSGTIASLYPITWLLFFISIIQKRRIEISVLLFISTFSYVLFVLSYVGRDGILFWIMMFLFNYFLFKSFLSPNDRRVLIKYFKYVSLGLIILFFVMTFSRFGDREYPTYLAFVDYMGQQVKVFNDIFSSNFTLSKGAMSFGFFIEIFEVIMDNTFIPDQDASLQKITVQLLSQDVYTWKFGTFIKEFYMDFGFWGPLFGGLCFATTMRILLSKNNGIVSIEKLFIYSLSYQVVFHGVFYFRLYNRVGNFYILVCIFLACIFYFFPSKKHSILRAYPSDLQGCKKNGSSGKRVPRLTI